MRKPLLLMLLLTAVSIIHAREISPEQAMAEARQFFGVKAPRQFAAAAPISTVGNQESQPYYVFNSSDRSGFIIISGDDRAPKVLGYASTGSIDTANMPPQLNAILTQFAESLNDLPDVRHASWDKAAGISEGQGTLIPTANWGQGFPYNSQCPVQDGEPTLTGCVATAMAIVMKHHNWPKEYQWEDMPMNTETDPIDFDKVSPELARLMHDAGEAVFMQYDPYESGAYLDWIGHRMQYVFHYSPEAQYLGWENFGMAEWARMLKSNLDKGNPVIYDGFGTGGHHAFVIDGYDGEDRYHVNWGWNGMANGYFPLLDLTPFEGENFSEHQGMVINLEPDRDMNEYSECFVDFGYLWAVGANRTAAEMNVSVENIEKGKPFHLFNDLITITAGFEGQVGVAIVDEQENVKEVLRTSYISTYNAYDNKYNTTNLALRYYDLVPTCDIQSTDRLQLVSKHDKDSDYKLLLGTMEWPSSRPVIGNTPRRSTITFNIGDGISCEYARDGGEMTSLPVGKTVLDSYMGEFITLSFNKVNPEAEDPMNMELYGKFFTGDFQGWTGHEPYGYGMPIYADENIVNIKLIHLEDEAINLAEAGTLKDHISAEKQTLLGNLTITGKMDARDFWFLRDNCRNLTGLDLKGVSIETYTGGDGEWVPDNMTHPANTIPYMAIPSLNNLATLILPDNLEAIEGFSLQGLKLQSISIPAGVKSIGRDTFYANYELEAIEILNPEPIAMEFTPFDDTKCPAEGVLFLPAGGAESYATAEFWKDFKKIVERPMPSPLRSNVTLDNVTYACYIDEATVTGWEGQPVDVVIPEKFTHNGAEYMVTGIGDNAFQACSSLESFKMSDAITSIGNSAFFGCGNLKKLELSKNIDEIKYSTFQACANLEEFIFSPNIQYAEYQAFYGTGLKSVFIPKTLKAKSMDAIFGANANLEEYVVEEGSTTFTTIDGLLYRLTEKGLILEAFPGKRTGRVVLPAECTEVMRDVFFSSGVTELLFTDGLTALPQYSISGAHALTHLTIPKSVAIHENAINYCTSLESITLHDTPFTYASAISECPALTNIYIDADAGVNVNLNGLFADNYENLNIFSSNLDKDFEYAGTHTLFVPGGYAHRHNLSLGADVAEMWTYEVSPKKNLISVLPLIEGLSIDKVIINGRTATPTVPNGNLYQIIPSDTDPHLIAETAEGIDVKVEYTLHGVQTLTTHYTPEFNATLPDDIVSGVGAIEINGIDEVEAYGLDGVLLYKGDVKKAKQLLPPGLYIIRINNKTEKIHIRP